MKIVKDFKEAKEGDYYLFLPIGNNEKDKRKTIIIIGEKQSKLYFFSYKGIMEKDGWENKIIPSLIEFYSPLFISYKLNKKEIKYYKKLILVNSL